MHRPQVITRQARENPPAEQTTNIQRGQAFAHDGVWAGFAAFPGGASTGWHHHGDYATYAYVTSGAMTVEFGSGAASWPRSEKGTSSTSPGTWSTASRSPPVEAQVSSCESAALVPPSSTSRDRIRRHDGGEGDAVTTSREAVTATRTRGPMPMWRCAQAVTAVVVAMLWTAAPGVADAAAASDDVEAPTTATPAGSFDGVDYVQYDGVFAGHTSTGAFRVPYRITAPVDPEDGNGAVVMEPPHFATGLGTLAFQLGRKFLLGRRFIHAGVGYSTTSFGPGLDQRILDPTVLGTHIDGGVADGNGRTDDEIIADFARALATDTDAHAMVGQVRDTYLTGYSDAASVPLRLVASGQADGVFELALPVTVESPVDPQAALGAGRFHGKLLIVNSAADDSSNLVDSGAHPDQYRFYAVAATPHVSDPLVPLFSNQTTPASWIPALRAHFLQAHRWVRNRVPPPPSSGVDDGPRLPFVELGEAVFHTGFLGSYDNIKTITQLGFATHRAYTKAFNTAVDAYARAGSILPEEASEMMRRANLCPPLTYTQTYRDHYARFVAITPC